MLWNIGAIIGFVGLIHELALWPLNYARAQASLPDEFRITQDDTVGTAMARCGQGTWWRCTDWFCTC